MSSDGTPIPGRRAAVVDGLRTPFVKAGTDFRDLTAVELGALAVNELVARAPVRPAEVDSVVFGQVVPSPTVTLIGREMVLRTQLPRSVQAHTVARACATSIQAATDAADQIRLGHSACAVAGGVEVDVRRADLRLAAAGPGAGRALAGAQPGRAARRPRPPAAARPGAGAAGAQGADHRSHHGAERRADGPAERHLARGPGRLRPGEPPARGGGLGRGEVGGRR